MRFEGILSRELQGHQFELNKVCRLYRAAVHEDPRNTRQRQASTGPRRYFALRDRQSIASISLLMEMATSQLARHRSPVAARGKTGCDTERACL